MVEFLIGFLVGGAFTFIVFVVWGINQEEEEKEKEKHENLK